MSFYVARNVPSGHNAVFPFQLPESGVAASVLFTVHELTANGSASVSGASIGEDASNPGNYYITVPSGSMTSDKVYYAAISHGQIAFRLPLWSYDKSDHFDQVLHDLGNLATAVGNVDTKLVNMDLKLDAIEANLDGDIQALQTQMLNKNDAVQLAIETAITNSQNALTGEIDANETKIDSIQSDVTAGFAAGAKAADLAALDAKVVAARTEIDGIRVDTEDLQLRLGNLQGLNLGGVGQNDLAGALTTLYGHVDEVEGRIGAPTDGTSLADDLANVEAQLQADIGQAKADVISDITSAEGTITGAISASEGVVTGAISSSEGTITSAISTSEGVITGAITSQTANLLGSIGSANDPAGAAALTLFGRLQRNYELIGDVESDVAQVQTDLTALSSAQSTFRSATATALAGIETKVDLLETDADAQSRHAALVTEIDANETKIDAVKTRVDLLETEADAAQRQSDVLAGQTNIFNQFGTLATGTVGGALSEIKALLDAGVTNARLMPFVPSEMLAPMANMMVRFGCNVVDGGTGKLEDPDNSEVGVEVFKMLDDGSNSQVTALYEDAAKVTALAAASGAGIPSSLKVLKKDRMGVYSGFIELAGMEHGTFVFNFSCLDNDPSGTPEEFSTARYMTVRRRVSFSAYGAF